MQSVGFNILDFQILTAVFFDSLALSFSKVFTARMASTEQASWYVHT